jgi:hypothetical protein
MNPRIKEAAYGNLHGKLYWAGAIVLAGWMLWILRAFFGVSFFHEDKDTGDPVLGLLIIVVGLSVVILGWALLAVRRARILASRGALIDGDIVHMSVLKRLGDCPVTVAYKVNGIEYRKKKDMSSRLSVGTPVRVLYDPRNPRRAEILGVSYKLEEPKPEMPDVL